MCSFHFKISERLCLICIDPIQIRNYQKFASEPLYTTTDYFK